MEVETKDDVFTEPIPEITKKVTLPWYDVPYEEQVRSWLGEKLCCCSCFIRCSHGNRFLFFSWKGRMKL